VELLGIYNIILKTSKMLTLRLTGDSIAQYIETQQKEDKSLSMNYKRSAYVFGFGALTGPPAIQWFR
jgi:hypothetical protein